MAINEDFVETIPNGDSMSILESSTSSESGNPIYAHNRILQNFHLSFFNRKHE